MSEHQPTLKAPGYIKHLPFDYHRDLYPVRWSYRGLNGERYGFAMAGIDQDETERVLIRCVNRYYREGKLDELRLDRLGISMY